MDMDKRRAIQTMTRAAASYHANLEDQKVIFLYGVPAEVRKQLQTEGGKLFSIKGYEVYSVLEKVDKGIDMKKCFFAEEIEKILERGAF